MDYSRAPRYHIYDRHRAMVTAVANHESATISWKWSKEAGAGTLVIPGEREVADLLVPALRVHEEPLLISVYTPLPEPWTGRVSNAEYLDDGDGGPRLELTLVNDRIWLDAILAVANPGVTPELQDRESDVREGPLESVVKQYLAVNLGRLGSDLPVMVVPAPYDDPSPIVKLSARMVSTSELFADVLDRYGYAITARTFRTGDPLPAGLQYQPEPGTVLLDVASGRDTGRLLWQQEHLETFSVSSSEPKAYRAYVGLKGDGDSRPFRQYVDVDAKRRGGGYALPETFVDVSDDATDWQEAAKDELRKLAGGLSVNFTVRDDQPWRMGEDWAIGDMAYARIAGQLFSARITEVELRDEAGQTIVYEPKCGVADPARDEAVADAVARLVADIRRQRAGR